MSTPSHHRLSQLINQLYKVCLCYLAYGQKCCLILVHSFVVASCVNALGLKVESLEGLLHVSSPLGTRVRIDQICWDCELEISWILLMVDLRVIDISEFDVIFGMNLLTAHRVVTDYDRRRITAYTQDGIYVIFQGGKNDALP